MDPLDKKRDYTKLKVKELKQECKKLGLKKFSSLKKEGLLLRLLSHSPSGEELSSPKKEEKKKSLRGVSSTLLDPSFVTNEEYLNLGKILFDNPSQTFGVNTPKWIAKNIPIDFLNSITLLKIKTELNRIKKIFFEFFSVPPSNDKFFLNDEELMKDYLLSGSYIVYFRNILKRRDFFYSPKGDLHSPYFLRESGSNLFFTEIKELRTIIWNRELTKEWED